MIRSVRATVHSDDIAAAPAEDRLSFLREARAALRTGVMPCGCPLPADRRDLLSAYVEALALSVRPRLVVDEMGVSL